LAYLAVVTLSVSGLGLVGTRTSGASGADPLGYTVIGNPLSLNGCQLAHLDLTTGALTAFGPTDPAHCTVDLAMGPGNTALYGIQLVFDVPDDTLLAHLMRFDPTNGTATDLGQIGTFTMGSGPGPFLGPLTFDAAGNLLVYLVPATTVGPCGGDLAYCLFQVDPNHPSNATALGPVPQAMDIYYGMATSPTGTVVATRLQFFSPVSRSSTSTSTPTTSTPSTSTPGSSGATAAPTSLGPPTWGAAHAAIEAELDLTTVNTTNGSTTDVGAGLGPNHFVEGIDYDPSGTLWGIGSEGGFGLSATALTSNVYTIDPVSGVATLGPPITMGGTPTAVEALAIPGPVAPAAVVATPSFTG
jgi:hypothetical protein